MSQGFPISRSRRETAELVLTAAQTILPFNFVVFDALDIEVRLKRPADLYFGAPLVYGTDFTVQNIGNIAGGTITLLVSPVVQLNTRCKIKGKRTHERLTSITQDGRILPVSMEKELDIQTTVMQELRRDVDGMDAALLDAQAAAAASAASATASANSATASAASATSAQGSATAAASSASSASTSASNAAASAASLLNVAFLKDGSVAMTGALNAGTNKITNLGAGTAAGDAVNKGQLDAIAASAAGTFGNRTAAASANLTGRDIVWCLGRTTMFDCDPHHYRRLASAPSVPNAAYHFQDSTGAWFELYGDTYEPEVFGAVSNGSTDCTPAMLSALEYFRLRGGGFLKMRNKQRGAYLLAAELNNNVSGLTIASITGKFRINRTTLVDDTGVLAIRKAVGVPLVDAHIGDCEIHHTDSRDLIFASPTVGQTAFNISALNPRNIANPGFDFIVYRSTASLAVTKKVNLQSGEFTVNFSTGILTLATPIAAGEQLRVKRMSASAACCAVSMQGVSATEMLENCSVGNIEVYSDGSLYIGRMALWTRLCRFGTALIHGVDNRASYCYGANDRLVMGDIFVFGGAYYGILAVTALCMTDYTLDLNMWDSTTQACVDCIFGKVKAQKVFRGVSIVGSVFRATFDTIDCINVESYSLLVQDTTLAGESAFVHFPFVKTATNRNYAIWVMCSHTSIGAYDINGLAAGGYGIYFSVGNVGSSQVRNRIGAGQIIAVGGSGAAYFKDQFYLDISGLKATGGGVVLDAVQYSNISTQVDSFAGGVGLDILGNCYRINANVNIAGCNIGLRLNTGSQIHTVVGICNSNTTNFVNTATNTNTAALLTV